MWCNQDNVSEASTSIPSTLAVQRTPLLCLQREDQDRGWGNSPTIPLDIRLRCPLPVSRHARAVGGRAPQLTRTTFGTLLFPTPGICSCNAATVCWVLKITFLLAHALITAALMATFLKAITFIYNNVSLIGACWPIFMCAYLHSMFSSKSLCQR